jgi:hypothetical protein
VDLSSRIGYIRYLSGMPSSPGDLENVNELI